MTQLLSRMVYRCFHPRSRLHLRTLGVSTQVGDDAVVDMQAAVAGVVLTGNGAPRDQGA
jgi:hypothetical protein